MCSTVVGVGNKILKLGLLPQRILFNRRDETYMHVKYKTKYGNAKREVEVVKKVEKSEKISGFRDSIDFVK